MNTDEIVNKIRNIVRLARRAGTEGERVAAEAAAKRLADKHGIALESLDETDAEIVTGIYVDEKFQTLSAVELGYVSHILREHFGIILIQGRVAGSRKVKLTWVGTAINVDIAKHVFVLLMRSCKRDWGEARTARRLAKGINTNVATSSAMRHQLVALRNLNQRAFYDGWFYQIHTKLTEHPLRNDVEQFQAEKKDAERVFEKMRENENITQHKAKPKGGNTDRLSVALGLQAGAAISLSRPCGHNGEAAAARLAN